MASIITNALRTKPLEVIKAEEATADLPRSLSLFDLICVGVGSTVGSGIFATTADIISGTAGPAAVISWAIGGLVVCINALAYMELTTRIPSSGSTYAYTYHTIGELPAVIAAWLITLEYGMSGSGVARSWATKVQDWLVEEHPSHSWQWLNEDYTNLLGALIMALCVAVLLFGVRVGKWFINVITTVKVAIVLFMIIAGFAIMDTENLSPFVPERQLVDGSWTYGTQGIVKGASQAFFGYLGFDEVCCLAAEAQNPKRTMPLAVVGVVLITTFLSVFASLVLAGMEPYQDATSFGSGFEAQGYHWMAELARAGETVTMPVVVLVCFLAQPRVNYALACDGLMPKIFAKVDDNGSLFANTLLTGILFTIVAFVVPFDTLWDIISFGSLLSFNMSNAALMIVRTQKMSPMLAPKMVSCIAVFAFLAAFLYQIGYSNEGHEGCLYAAVVFLVITLVSCVAFFVKCPQEENDPANFTAPLVPFIPTIAMVANFYLSAQLSYIGIELSVAWIAAGVLSYFAYGYSHSAGRTGWKAVLSLPRESSMRSPMLTDAKKEIEMS